MADETKMLTVNGLGSPLTNQRKQKLIMEKSNETYDIVLANGRVIDPETYVDGQMHVGIKADRIAAVSETPLEGKEVIDVSGLIVAPGFIDLHAHGQDIAANRMQGPGEWTS